MELARAGIPLSEVRRDPRPSNVRRLREAVVVIKAREALEESDNTISNAGLQGEMLEYENGRLKTSSGKFRTEAVGYQRWYERKREEAYPEYFTEAKRLAAEVERQRRMADSFFGTAPKGKDPSKVKLRYVKDKETGHARFVQVQSEDDPARGAAGDEGVAQGSG